MVVVEEAGKVVYHRKTVELFPTPGSPDISRGFDLLKLRFVL
jgi:hypothetical protein